MDSNDDIDALFTENPFNIFPTKNSLSIIEEMIEQISTHNFEETKLVEEDINWLSAPLIYFVTNVNYKEKKRLFEMALDQLCMLFDPKMIQSNKIKHFIKCEITVYTKICENPTMPEKIQKQYLKKIEDMMGNNELEVTSICLNSLLDIASAKLNNSKTAFQLVISFLHNLNLNNGELNNDFKQVLHEVINRVIPISNYHENFKIFEDFLNDVFYNNLNNKIEKENTQVTLFNILIDLLPKAQSLHKCIDMIQFVETDYLTYKKPKANEIISIFKDCINVCDLNFTDLILLFGEYDENEYWNDPIEKYLISCLYNDNDLKILNYINHLFVKRPFDMERFVIEMFNKIRTLQKITNYYHFFSNVKVIYPTVYRIENISKKFTELPIPFSNLECDDMIIFSAENDFFQAFLYLCSISENSENLVSSFLNNLNSLNEESAIFVVQISDFIKNSKNILHIQKIMKNAIFNKLSIIFQLMIKISFSTFKLLPNYEVKHILDTKKSIKYYSTNSLIFLLVETSNFNCILLISYLGVSCVEIKELKEISEIFKENNYFVDNKIIESIQEIPKKFYSTINDLLLSDFSLPTLQVSIAFINDCSTNIFDERIEPTQNFCKFAQYLGDPIEDPTSTTIVHHLKFIDIQYESVYSGEPYYYNNLKSKKSIQDKRDFLIIFNTNQNLNKKRILERTSTFSNVYCVTQYIEGYYVITPFKLHGISFLVENQEFIVQDKNLKYAFSSIILFYYANQKMDLVLTKKMIKMQKKIEQLIIKMRK